MLKKKHTFTMLTKKKQITTHSYFCHIVRILCHLLPNGHCDWTLVVAVHALRTLLHGDARLQRCCFAAAQTCGCGYCGHTGVRLANGAKEIRAEHVAYADLLAK